MKAGQPPTPAFHTERHLPQEHATGCVSIGGAFALDHHDEIIDLVRQFAGHENDVYPEKRILSIRAEPNVLLIDTNDVRLARAIGEMLCRTYQGALTFHFAESDCLVRVHWDR